MSNVTPIYFDLRQYPVEIFWCPFTNGFIGAVIDIPDVLGFGLSRSEAAIATEKALQEHCRHQKLLGNGELIPHPRRSQFSDAHKRLRRA